MARVAGHLAPRGSFGKQVSSSCLGLALLGCAVLASQAAAAVQAQVSLATAWTLTTGASPFAVAVGDVNGDGALDLAVANADAHTVSLFLGTGDGRYGPRTDFATGRTPSSVAIGPVRAGDARLSLVVANFDSDSVSVITVSATGASFVERVDYPTGRGPFALALGDLNGDGVADIAVANYWDHTVTVLLQGPTPRSTTYPTGANPITVALPDLNGDGRLDLVVAIFTANTVSLRLGAGDGSFGPPTDLPAGDGPASLAVADVTGDGTADLLVANFRSATVSILPGDGTGGFAPAPALPVAPKPRSVAVGDLNFDGLPDLAVASLDRGTVSVSLGTGRGAFGPPLEIATGAGARAVAVADLNRDGKPDLVVANADAAHASVLLNTTPFAPAVAFASEAVFPAGDGPFAVAVGPLFADAHPGIVVANYDSNTVSVLRGAGGGDFQPKIDFAAGRGPMALALGDLNGDGRSDLAIANFDESTLKVYLLGLTPGHFTTWSPPMEVLDQPVSVALGDLNRDGRTDLVIAGYGAHKFNAFLGTGGGNLARTSFWDSPAPDAPSIIAVAVADVDGDGIPDVVTADFDADTVSVWLGTPDGQSFIPAPGRLLTGSRPSAVAVADLNGDGKPDLMAANYRSDTVSVFLGNGDGTFRQRTDFATHRAPRSVAVADVNADGKTDVVVANFGSNDVSVLLGDGSGTLLPRLDLPVGTGPKSVAIADVNGDARPDIVVANYGSNDVSVLLNDSRAADGLARMTTPAPGSILPPASATFAWTTGENVTEYWLAVGRTPGGTEYFGASVGGWRSWSVTGLPADGSPVYVRLSSRIDGVWRSNDYTYLATPPPPPVMYRLSITFASVGPDPGWGRVTSSPPGIDCAGTAWWTGPSCSHSFATGTSIGLTIERAHFDTVMSVSGCSFSWIGLGPDPSIGPTLRGYCTLVLNQDTTVTVKLRSGR